MKKKDKLPGQCYYIGNDREDNPKLGAKILSDGRESLFIDYYLGMLYDDGKPRKNRKRESLSLYLLSSPRTPIERTTNKETLVIAKKIRDERAQELLQQEKGYRLPNRQVVNFLDYMAKYELEYTKKDIRMIHIARQRFIDFLNDTPEYNKYTSFIKPNMIDSDMMLAFTEYLQSRSKGEGAKSIYQRFKKMYRACAIDNDINSNKPFVIKKGDDKGKTITIKVDEMAIVKDYLSPEEIKKLKDTTYIHQSQDIRDAFLFCVGTGMRYCDVRDLTFGNIDLPNKKLSFNQNKTKGHSTKSNVTLDLPNSLLAMIQARQDGKGKDDLVFNLPSHEACNKALGRWVKRAGINKHITWHGARHTFGTIMAEKAQIRVVQEMMGHSSLKYTERYTRVVNEQKKNAMSQMGEILD